MAKKKQRINLIDRDGNSKVVEVNSTVADDTSKSTKKSTASSASKGGVSKVISDARNYGPLVKVANTVSGGTIGTLNSLGKKDKEGHTLADNVLQVGKNVRAGVQSGLTSIPDSKLYEVRNNLEKGEKKEEENKNAKDSAKSMLKSGGKALLYTLSPTLGKVIDNFSHEEQTGNAFERTLKSANKSYSALGGESGLNATEEALGQWYAVNQKRKGGNDKLSKKVENLQEKIDKPADEYAQKVQEENQNYGKGVQFAGNVGQTVGNMVPSMVVSAATQNPNLGLATMYYQSKGSSTKEALAKGADLETANAIGTAKGGLEVGTEKLFGGIKFKGKSVYGKGSLDDVIEKNVNRLVKNKAANWLVKQIGVNNLGEVAEETISDLVGTLIDKNTVDPNASYSLKDWGNTAGQTIASTLVLNLLGGSFGKSSYNQNVQSMAETQVANIQNMVQNGQMTQEDGARAIEEVTKNLNNDYDNENITTPEEVNEALMNTTPEEIQQAAVSAINVVNEQIQQGKMTQEQGQTLLQNIEGNAQNLLQEQQAIQTGGQQNTIEAKMQIVQNLNDTERAALTEVAQKVKAGEQLNDNDKAVIGAINNNHTSQEVESTPTKGETTQPNEMLNKNEIKESIKNEIKELYKKREKFISENQIGDGFLSKSGRQEYEKMSKEISDLRYELETKHYKEINEGNIKDDRKTALDKSIYVQARKDILVNKNIYDAIEKAAHGVGINEDTAVDDIMNRKNNNVSPEDLYHAFDKTREELRKKYGDEITLYRVESNQKAKPTKNYGSSIEYTKQYGNDVREYKIKTDDIVAINTNRTGRYEDIIVAQGGIDKYLNKQEELQAPNETEPINETKGTEDSSFSNEQIRQITEEDKEKAKQIDIKEPEYDEKLGPIASAIDNTMRKVQGKKEGEKYLGVIKNPSMSEVVEGKLKQRNDYINDKMQELTQSSEQEETNKPKNVGVHYGDLGKARDTYYWNINSSNRSTGHYGTGTYFVSNEESNRMQNSSFTRSDRPRNEIDFDDYNLYKPLIESEAKRLHDGLKAINYNKYDDFDYRIMVDDLKRNGITQEQIDNARNATEEARQQYEKEGYNDKYDAEVDSLSTVFMKNLGFDGIDVRGLEGYDNTSYGSVIYDLKNNEQTKQENIPDKVEEQVIKVGNKEVKATDKESKLEKELSPEELRDLKIKEVKENLETDYDEENIPKILKNNEIAKEKTPTKEKLKNLATISKMLYGKLVDKGEALAEIGRKTGNKELYPTYDKSLLYRGIAQYQIGNAQTDFDGTPLTNFVDKNGNNVSMSWEGIYKDANKAKISDNVLDEYLVAQLNIDRLNQGINQFNIPESVSQETIARLEQEHPEIKRVAENVYTYSRNRLEKMVKSGLVTEEIAEEFRNKYPHYVRIQRDIKKGKGTLTYDKHGKVMIDNGIQNVKGGSYDILPIKETAANYEIQLERAMRLNQVGLELEKSLATPVDSEGKINQINEEGELLDFDPNEDTILGEAVAKGADGNYTFTIWMNGEPVRLQIDARLYEALKTNRQSWLEQKITQPTIGKLASIQRALLTDKNPIFLATNFLKDIGDAPLNSKYGTAEFFKNYAVAMNEMRKGKNSKLWQLYLANGGLQNSYFENMQFNDTGKNKVQKGMSKVADSISKANNVIEQLPRFAEFITSVNHGCSLNEAMYNSAEITTNFKRGGNVTKTLNRNGFNFLNASVQGFDKQVRNFAQIGTNRKAFVKYLAKATILGLAPALVNDLMYDDDDEYKNLKDYVKDQYYLYKLGNGTWLRIPKGRVMSIFGAAGRRAKEYASGNKDAFKGFLQTASNQIAPNNPLDNNIISPFIAVKNNRSWSGNEIVSDYESKNYYAEDQYDNSTDKFSIWLGKKLKKSPKMINYLLDQYTGGIGDIVLPAASNEANNNVLKDKFTTDEVMKGKTAGEFYSALYDASKAKNHLSKEGKKDSLEYQEKNKVYSYLYSVSLSLGDLKSQQDEIERDNTLSKKEKYDKVKEIQKEINKEMQEAVDNSQDVERTDEYIRVGDVYYMKHTKKDGTVEYKKKSNK